MSLGHRDSRTDRPPALEVDRKATTKRSGTVHGKSGGWSPEFRLKALRIFPTSGLLATRESIQQRYPRRNIALGRCHDEISYDDLWIGICGRYALDFYWWRIGTSLVCNVRSDPTRDDRRYSARVSMGRAAYLVGCLGDGRSRQGTGTLGHRVAEPPHFVQSRLGP